MLVTLGIVIEDEIARTDLQGLRAYLLGALKDGTRSARHGTHRFGQSDPGWLELLGSAL